MCVCVPVVAFVIHHLCAISSTPFGWHHQSFAASLRIYSTARVCVCVCVLPVLCVGVRNKHAQLAQL